MLGYALCLILAICAFGDAFKLPHWIKPCSRKDVNFDKCAVESAKLAIPYITLGDRSLQIPNMRPLKIPLVELNTGDKFTLKIKNLEIHGLENLVPTYFKTDFVRKTGVTTTHIDKLVILGDYEIYGKISVLPVKGHGPLNITLVGADYTYTYTWDLHTKNGLEYITNVKGEFDYKLQRAYYNLENLFDGDRTLGDNVNKFFNENWKEVSEDMKPSISKTLSVIYGDISRKMYTQIPYNELFLD